MQVSNQFTQVASISILLDWTQLFLFATSTKLLCTEWQWKKDDLWDENLGVVKNDVSLDVWYKPGAQLIVLSCWNSSGVTVTDEIKSLYSKRTRIYKIPTVHSNSTCVVLLNLVPKTSTSYVLFTTRHLTLCSRNLVVWRKENLHSKVIYLIFIITFWGEWLLFPLYICIGFNVELIYVYHAVPSRCPLVWKSEELYEGELTKRRWVQWSWSYDIERVNKIWHPWSHS